MEHRPNRWCGLRLVWLLNDGATFVSFWNTTGGNNTPNTLYDEPGVWADNTFFFAVDAAVCFWSDTCTN